MSRRSYGLLLFVLACSSSEAIQRRQECVPSEMQPAPPVLLTGKRAEVRLALELPCQRSVHADSAETSVAGPDNLPVEFTASAVENDAVVVSFTPERAGYYHLVAKLQPNVGIVQVDAMAALDFTAAPAEHFVPRLDCDAFGVTTSGAVVCSTGIEVHVARDRRDLQTISGTRFAVRDDDVWVAGETEATRWHDVGSGGLVQQLPSLALLEPPLAVVATGTGLLVVSAYSVRYYELSAGAFVGRASWRYSYAGPWAIAAFDGTNLLLRTGASQCRSEGADAGALACEGISDPLLGVSEGGLWIRSGRRAAGLWLPGKYGPVALLDPPGDAFWEEGSRQGIAPHIPFGPYTIGWQDGEAVLAKWNAVPALAIDGWAVFRTESGFELRRSSVR